VNSLEENEQLLIEQMKVIKDELKVTKRQKEEIQKRLEDVLDQQDGRRIETINMLRSAVEKLIPEMQMK
jgi:hypothetical protein